MTQPGFVGFDIRYYTIGLERHRMHNMLLKFPVETGFFYFFPSTRTCVLYRNGIKAPTAIKTTFTSLQNIKQKASVLHELLYDNSKYIGK